LGMVLEISIQSQPLAMFCFSNLYESAGVPTECQKEKKN
jgi:hypothetical protein